MHLFEPRQHPPQSSDELAGGTYRCDLFFVCFLQVYECITLVWLLPAWACHCLTYLFWVCFMVSVFTQIAMATERWVTAAFKVVCTTCVCCAMWRTLSSVSQIFTPTQQLHEYVSLFLSAWQSTPHTHKRTHTWIELWLLSSFCSGRWRGNILKVMAGPWKFLPAKTPPVNKTWALDEERYK